MLAWKLRPPSVRRSTPSRASEGDSTLPDYQTDGPTTDRLSDPGWELELALCWQRHGWRQEIHHRRSRVFGNMHRGMQERRGATKGSSGVRASLSFGGGEGPKEIPAGNFSPSFAALCVHRRNRHRRVVRAIPARGQGYSVDRK